MPRPALCAVFTFLCVSAAHGQSAPRADHHQHLFSPAIAELISAKPIAADDPVARLDAAGIKRAAVLSVAYMFGSPSRIVEQEYEKVKAENDWTGREVARFPDRLIGFCGFNPLADYALDELTRCTKSPQLRYGIKLHFGNSVVDYHNRDHVERVRKVFAAANQHRMAIAVHMRASISRKMAYGRDEARIFLNDLVPAAPDVPIQIAHLAGAGGYGDRLVDQALSVFVDAIEKGDPRAKQLYFDVTSVALRDATADQASLLARRGRRRQPAAAGRVGGVPQAPVDRGRIRDHRRQRPAVHALIHFTPGLHAFSLVSNGFIPSLSTNQATVATGSVARLAQNM